MVKDRNCYDVILILLRDDLYQTSQRKKQRQSLALVHVVSSLTITYLTHSAPCQMAQLLTTVILSCYAHYVMNTSGAGDLMSLFPEFKGRED